MGIIGLDLGTSSVKAGLFDLDGHELATARTGLGSASPHPEYAEQDPLEWDQAVQAVLKEVTEKAGSDGIQAVGLSGQCPGHVLVGAGGRPVSPAIIWRDRRAMAEAAWLAEHISPAKAREWLGSPSLGDASMPPSRLLWLSRHRRDMWQNSWKVFQPKDYVGYTLTGEAGSDAHTSFLLNHPDTGQVHPGFLELLGARADMFPEIRQPSGLLGEVTSRAEAVTGLKAGTPVYMGTIDAYCEILAAGGYLPGQAVDTAGTSEMISLGIDRPVEGAGVFFGQIEGAGQFLCGPTQSGCGLQDWVARVFFPGEAELPGYTRLEQEAALAPAGCDGLVFLPYVFGERAPVWDARASGAYTGITSRHDRRHFTRAMYESVAFVIRHVLDVCTLASGTQVDSVVCCGGGSHSHFWNQIKADVLQKTVQPLQTHTSACLGAAMLAAAGCGAAASLQEASTRMGLRAEAVLPDHGLAEIYNRSYEMYRQIYPALNATGREPG